ncbi:ATP-binding protein [Planctomycetota bacterium]
MTRPAQPNRRLLIIDDNQSIHDDFRTILIGNTGEPSALHTHEEALFDASNELDLVVSFAIDSAFQGEEAFEKVRLAQSEERPYAVAFVGVRMPPGWDGVTTIQKLWQIAPNLEVVICTAYSDHDWKSIVNALGHSHQLLILKKPYDNIEVKQIAIALTEKWNLAHEARQRQNRLEEMVSERTSDLAAINSELEQFAYVVSHDLKTPLRGIQTLANWIASDYGDKLEIEGVEQLHLLQARTQRMHDLIDGILQYSRVGRAEGQKTQVNLHTLISEVTEGIAPPAHIAITMDSLLPTLNIEAVRIFQVFQNLLSNAVKYCDKSKGIIHVGCEEQADVWQFTVTDNGCGIEEKYFERIFQLFQKLADSDDYESTGLGLTLVKKIVESQGGKIWVESELGTGSTFWFTLPKQDNLSLTLHAPTNMSL